MKTLKQSLRKRPTYNELIDYLENDQPIIKYPDRTATFLRNSPYLSKYDDPSMLDLEEQENQMEREKMREAEVKRIASETKSTASLLRGRAKARATTTTQTNVSFRDAGTDPRDKPEMSDVAVGKRGREKGIQADKEIFGAEYGTQTETQPQIFDMTIDDATDAAMEEIELARQEAKQQEEKKKQLIYDKVARHNREEVRDLPYLRASTSSSSNQVPAYLMKPPEPAEDTSNPRGRPPKSDKPMIINDSENTTQPRGRKPMIVNTEGEQQKRGKSYDTSSPPPRKRLTKTKADKQLKALELAAKKEAKEEAKAEKKAIAAAKKEANEAIAQAKAAAQTQESTEEPKTRKEHGVEKIENNDKSFWKKQNITILKQQAELRGYRFTDLETKGGTKTVKGVSTKFNKFKKKDYLEVLFKLLKI